MHPYIQTDATGGNKKIFSTSLLLEEYNYIFTKGSGDILKVGRSPVFVREIWKIEQKNVSLPLKFILKSHISQSLYRLYLFLSKSTSYFNTYTIYSVV